MIRPILNRAVRKCFNKFGFELTRSCRAVEPAPPPGPPDYSDVHPIARYSPWGTDRGFCTIYELVRSNTLVDKYRCYELWRLAKQMERLEGSFIEIGVWKGGTGCLLAAAAQKHTILCDTFRGVVKAGQHDTFYKGGEHSDATEEEVRSLASQLRVLDRIQILRGVFPDDTGSCVTERIAFCHIDVDVYASARDVFIKIWPLIVSGGVVVFDDYGFQGCEGVTRFVNEISPDDSLFIHNLNGHAILVKV